jgi:TolB protein
LIGGKIAGMKAWIGLAALLLTSLQLGACGGPQPATCGMGGGRPHPEIGGEVLYYCSDWPRVNGGLYLLNVATGRVRALTSDLAWNLDGAWSPDGSRIAFQSTRDGRDDIFVMDAGGSRVRKLTDGRGFNQYPAWSPDGEWILFSSSRDGVADSAGSSYYRDLYLMRPDGSDIHRLIRHLGAFAFAAWSPDGRHLAFQSDRAGTWNVYTIGVDGNALEQLTHYVKTDSGAGFPRWSPDGARIAFGAGATTPALIYWLAVGDDKLHQVTVAERGLQFDVFPDWSPDGKWIAFERRGNDSQIFAVRPDGTNLTQLTGGPGVKELPRWRPT